MRRRATPSSLRQHHSDSARWAASGDGVMSIGGIGEAIILETQL